MPAWFQLSDLGKPVRFSAPTRSAVERVPAAGGSGPVTYDTTNPPAGSVLVTTTLSPGLGPLLPRLRGIVAETGSVLSHLAILAREARVPTVVGYAGATGDLPGKAPRRRRRHRAGHDRGHGVEVVKIIAWLAGLGTLLAGAFYLVVSLNRWEWNRALFFGLIVLIAEVALATGLVLRRLARLEHN